MPFQSKSQMRACFAKDDPDWDCHQWAHETPNRKKLPERKKKMNFKEFYSEAELNEGPIGRFVGGVAGTALPALFGAYVSNYLMGGAGGSMFGTSGAPGGLAGLVVGGTRGRNMGVEIGDNIGNQIWSFLKKTFSGPKSATTGEKYLDKFKTTHSPGEEEDEPKLASADIQTRKNKSQRELDNLANQDYLVERENRRVASNLLAKLMGSLGFGPKQIQAVGNLGADNYLLTYWERNYMPEIIQISKAGDKREAGQFALKGIMVMMERGMLGKPLGKPRRPDGQKLPESEPLANPNSATSGPRGTLPSSDRYAELPTDDNSPTSGPRGTLVPFASLADNPHGVQDRTAQNSQTSGPRGPRIAPPRPEKRVPDMVQPSQAPADLFGNPIEQPQQIRPKKKSSRKKRAAQPASLFDYPESVESDEYEEYEAQERAKKQFSDLPTTLKPPYPTGVVETRPETKGWYLELEFDRQSHRGPYRKSLYIPIGKEFPIKDRKIAEQVAMRVVAQEKGRYSKCSIFYRTKFQGKSFFEDENRYLWFGSGY